MNQQLAVAGVPAGRTSATPEKTLWSAFLMVGTLILAVGWVVIKVLLMLIAMLKLVVGIATAIFLFKLLR